MESIPWVRCVSGNVFVESHISAQGGRKVAIFGSGEIQEIGQKMFYGVGFFRSNVQLTVCPNIWREKAFITK